MQDRRVLITGAGGRVGAALALELAKDNEVHGIDLFERNRERLERGGAVFHKLDLATDDLSGLPDAFDYVFHQAVTWAVTNREQEIAARNVSVNGVVRLTRKYYTARRIVLGSTGGVLRESDRRVDESALREPDTNPYHAYKFAMEVVGEAIAEEYGVDIVIPRYYWPWSASNGFPHAWVIVSMLRGEPVQVCGTKPIRTTPLFMPDCVRYSIALAEAEDAPRVLHLAGPDVVSIEEMACIVGELLGVEPRFEDTRPPFVSFLGDPSLCCKLFGAPEYDVRRSLEAAVEWHRRHPEEHRRRDVFDAPGTW
jgi:nucleoside-diphosphate-sugar epimerase